MKKFFVTMIVCMVALLSGCGNMTLEEAMDVLEDSGYLVELHRGEFLISLHDISEEVEFHDEFESILVVKKEHLFMTAFYFSSKEEAAKFYSILEYLYFHLIYASDIYGIKNAYLLYYGEIEEPKIWEHEIDFPSEVFLSNGVNTELLYYYNLDYRYSFPFGEFPSSYQEFLDNYTEIVPQYYRKNNVVYFGSKSIIDLIT